MEEETEADKHFYKIIIIRLVARFLLFPFLAINTIILSDWYHPMLSIFVHQFKLYFNCLRNSTFLWLPYLHPVQYHFSSWILQIHLLSYIRDVFPDYIHEVFSFFKSCGFISLLTLFVCSEIPLWFVAFRLYLWLQITVILITWSFPLIGY